MFDLPYSSALSGDSSGAVPHASSPEARWEGVVAGLAGKTVVIVEDEGITQLQIRRALARAGMKVLGFASDGKAGVETVLATKPDLVLMDVKMPGEVDGLSATREILGQISTCVVILTAYDEFEEEACQAGACGYIVKPVTYQMLIPKVQAALDRHNAA